MADLRIRSLSKLYAAEASADNAHRLARAVVRQGPAEAGVAELESQRDYRDALEEVGEHARDMRSVVSSLAINDDFMMFGDRAMEEHLECIAAARRKAEHMVRLLSAVEVYAAREVLEGKSIPARTRLEMMGG